MNNSSSSSSNDNDDDIVKVWKGRASEFHHTGKYGGNNWRQSRPKYTKGEPENHRKAKERVVSILEDMGYSCVTADHPSQEWHTPALDFLGQPIPFPIDIFAQFFDYEQSSRIEMEAIDTILVQIDGGYHYANNKQSRRTALRDLVISNYCINQVGETGQSYRYKTFLVEEALELADEYIRKRLEPTV